MVTSWTHKSLCNVEKAQTYIDTAMINRQRAITAAIYWPKGLCFAAVEAPTIWNQKKQQTSVTVMHRYIFYIDFSADQTRFTCIFLDFQTLNRRQIKCDNVAKTLGQILAHFSTSFQTDHAPKEKHVICLSKGTTLKAHLACHHRCSFHHKLSDEGFN